MREQGEYKYEPFTLIIDDERSSQLAVKALEDAKVLFAPARSIEMRAPMLVTSVGSFRGLDSILRYITIHHNVDRYLKTVNTPAGLSVNP